MVGIRKRLLLLSPIKTILYTFLNIHTRDRNNSWYTPVLCSWSTNTPPPSFLIFRFFLILAPYRGL